MEYNKWYKDEDDERPNNCDTVIVAVWYDGWNYDIGEYNSEKDEIISLTNLSTNIKYITYSFDDIYRWMVIKEPDI